MNSAILLCFIISYSVLRGPLSPHTAPAYEFNWVGFHRLPRSLLCLWDSSGKLCHERLQLTNPLRLSMNWVVYTAWACQSQWALCISLYKQGYISIPMCITYCGNYHMYKWSISEISVWLGSYWHHEIFGTTLAMLNWTDGLSNQTFRPQI